MDGKKDEKVNFISIMNFMKREFRSLTDKYPEIRELSRRELEVFLALLSDKTQNQIAEELFVSASAVHFHTKNIYKKLGVSGRKQLLIKYKDV